VDVIVGIIWRVVLDDPVNVREIEPSLGHIGTKEHSGFGLVELKVDRGSFLLFLLSVDVADLDIDIVQEV
jgi:hypothetical protein